ncbi:MAG: hypothetical protein ACREQH_02790 [Candidatus Binatus sp.]
MKVDAKDQLSLAPREERAILDQIRNDHELIDRLGITPQELEALSKCALLGTLTCKQDMLFILRQIRDSDSPSIDQSAIFSQPAPIEDEEEAIPDFRQIHSRLTPGIIPEPGSLDGIVRRRLPEQFGVLFWVVVVAGVLVWNGIIIMSRWRDNVMTTFGTTVTPTPLSDTWYSHLDRFSVLLWAELTFVAGMVALTYFKSRRDSRRFKVRPGRR